LKFLSLEISKLNEHVSNVAMKATWQENVLKQETLDLNLKVVEELALSVEKKVTFLANAQLVRLVEEETELVSSVGKMVTRVSNVKNLELLLLNVT